MPSIISSQYGVFGHFSTLKALSNTDQGCRPLSATLGNVRWTAAILKGLCRTPSKKSFQEEFRRLLTKYGLDVDERYVWD
jgi:hypothetical protein